MTLTIISLTWCAVFWCVRLKYHIYSEGFNRDLNNWLKRLTIRPCGKSIYYCLGLVMSIYIHIYIYIYIYIYNVYILHTHYNDQLILTLPLSLNSFSFYDQPKPIKSKVIWESMNPHFDFRQQISIPQVGQDLLKYLQSHALVMELWGTQGMWCIVNYIFTTKHIKQNEIYLIFPCFAFNFHDSSRKRK